jgi:hypothetical protein
VDSALLLSPDPCSSRKTTVSAASKSRKGKSSEIVDGVMSRVIHRQSCFMKLISGCRQVLRGSSNSSDSQKVRRGETSTQRLTALSSIAVSGNLSLSKNGKARK